MQFACTHLIFLFVLKTILVGNSLFSHFGVGTFFVFLVMELHVIGKQMHVLQESEGTDAVSYTHLRAHET